MWSYAFGIAILAGLVATLISLGTSVTGTTDATYLPYALTQFFMVSAYLLSGTAISAGDAEASLLNAFKPPSHTKLPKVRRFGRKAKVLFTLLGIATTASVGLYDIRFAWLSALIAVGELVFISTLNALPKSNVNPTTNSKTVGNNANAAAAATIIAQINLTIETLNGAVADIGGKEVAVSAAIAGGNPDKADVLGVATDAEGIVSILQGLQSLATSLIAADPTGAGSVSTIFPSQIAILNNTAASETNIAASVERMEVPVAKLLGLNPSGIGSVGGSISVLTDIANNVTAAAAAANVAYTAAVAYTPSLSGTTMVNLNLVVGNTQSVVNSARVVLNDTLTLVAAATQPTPLIHEPNILIESNKRHSKWTASWVSNIVIGAILITIYNYFGHGNSITPIIMGHSYQWEWFFCLFLSSVTNVISAWYAAPFFVYIYYFYGINTMNTIAQETYVTNPNSSPFISNVAVTTGVDTTYTLPTGATAESVSQITPLPYPIVPGTQVSNTVTTVDANKLRFITPTTKDYYGLLATSTILLGATLYIEPKLDGGDYETLFILLSLGSTFLVYYNYAKDIITQWSSIDFTVMFPGSVSTARIEAPIKVTQTTTNTTGYLLPPLNDNDVPATAPITTTSTLRTGQEIPNTELIAYLDKIVTPDVEIEPILVPTFDTRRNVFASLIPVYFVQTYVLYWLGYFYPDISFMITVVYSQYVFINNWILAYGGTGLGAIIASSPYLAPFNTARAVRQYSYDTYKRYNPQADPNISPPLPLNPNYSKPSFWGWLATLQWVPFHFNLAIMAVSYVGIGFVDESLSPYVNPYLDANHSVAIFFSFILGMYLVLDSYFNSITINLQSEPAQIVNKQKWVAIKQFFKVVSAIIILVTLVGSAISGHLYFLGLDTAEQHTNLLIFFGIDLAVIAGGYAFGYVKGFGYTRALVYQATGVWLDNSLDPKHKH
jgi:hypothetical protein